MIYIYSTTDLHPVGQNTPQIFMPNVIPTSAFDIWHSETVKLNSLETSSYKYLAVSTVSVHVRVKYKASVIRPFSLFSSLSKRKKRGARLAQSIEYVNLDLRIVS